MIHPVFKPFLLQMLKKSFIPNAAKEKTGAGNAVSQGAIQVK
jgi:hypothetical protein